MKSSRTKTLSGDLILATKCVPFVLRVSERLSPAGKGKASAPMLLRLSLSENTKLSKKTDLADSHLGLTGQTWAMWQPLSQENIERRIFLTGHIYALKNIRVLLEKKKEKWILGRQLSVSVTELYICIRVRSYSRVIKCPVILGMDLWV